MTSLSLWPVSPLISAAKAPLFCSAGKRDLPQCSGFSSGDTFPHWQDGFHSTRDVFLLSLLCVLFPFTSEVTLS